MACEKAGLLESGSHAQPYIQCACFVFAAVIVFWELACKQGVISESDSSGDPIFFATAKTFFFPTGLLMGASWYQSNGQLTKRMLPCMHVLSCFIHAWVLHECFVILIILRFQLTCRFVGSVCAYLSAFLCDLFICFVCPAAVKSQWRNGRSK